MSELIIASKVAKDVLDINMKKALEPFLLSGSKLETSFWNDDETGFVSVKYQSQVDKKKPVSDEFCELKSTIARTIVSIIQHDFATYFILVDLNNRDAFLGEQSKEILREEALLFLKSEMKAKKDFYLSEENLLKLVSEYLRDFRRFNIDGFIQFRLKKFQSIIKKHIDKIIEKYLVDAEQKEFIRLLKYFVKTQEDKHDIVHLLRKSEGGFIILDKDLHILTDEYCEDLMNCFVDVGSTFEDLLMSALITVAPKSIVVHMELADSVNETLNSVFGDRLKSCVKCVSNNCSIGKLSYLGDLDKLSSVNGIVSCDEINDSFDNILSSEFCDLFFADTDIYKVKSLNFDDMALHEECSTINSPDALENSLHGMDFI